MSGAVIELLARCRIAGLALVVEGDALHVDFESDPPAHRSDRGHPTTQT
jgi:hypothetical protein